MKKLLPLMVLGVVAGLGLLLLLGIIRYGGIDGLRLRVRAEMATYVKHDAFVPTPLPTPITDVQFEMVSPTLTPTSMPPLTPSDSPLNSSPLVDPTTTPISIPPLTLTQVPSTTPSPVQPNTIRGASTTATISPSTTPTPVYQTTAPTVELTGFRHEWQTWNNCGPATLAMYLSYYGSSLTQADISSVIRPNKEDKHAAVQQLAAFARSQGLRALVRVNGDADRLRLFLDNGIPVMMPTWHVDPEDGGMGHYRLLTGYDHAKEEWILYDSLESRGVIPNQEYRGIRASYQSFDAWWRVYNRLYILTYAAEMEPAVQAIVGEDLNDQAMWERSLWQAQQEIEARPEDAFAWFTLGTNLVASGRSADAASAYDQARFIGLPFRTMWYQFGAFQAYYDSGRYEEVVALADATIKVTADVEELHYWRGRALAALGDVEGAREALQRALTQRPGFPEALDALEQLGN